MSDIKDLLQQYAEACFKLGMTDRFDDAKSLSDEAGSLWQQIENLFVQARSEGARVEREAIRQIAKKELLGLDCAQERVVTRIVRAIEERNQSDERKDGE